MSHSEGIISFGDYQYSKAGFIASGTFGAVFKGSHKRRPNQTLAIKRIKKTKSPKQSDKAGKESDLLKELRHKNLVHLIDFEESDDFVYLVMEYCNGGDMATYLRKKGRLSEDTIRFFLQQIASAMKFLHCNNILHRDLKPENLLLCSKTRDPKPHEITIKIADFGLSRYLPQSQLATTHCGTYIYMAPELFIKENRHAHNESADLWSIGVIIYYCFTGNFPFVPNGNEEMYAMYKRNKGVPPRIPSGTSRDLYDLLINLLRKDVKNRIKFSGFFGHPFLAKKAKQIAVAGIKQLEDEQFLKSEVVFRAAKLLKYFNSSKTWSKSCSTWEKNHKCSITTEQNNTPVQVPDRGARASICPSTIQYNVYQGDISDEATDAIVIGVFNDFNLNEGEIAHAVLKKAGQYLQIECYQNPLVSTNCLRVTKGYNLSCNYVFHLVTPNSAQDLTKRVKIVLDEAQRLGISSMSFPTIGAGGSGMGVQQVAFAMRKAFQEFEEENRLVRYSVKNINVVVFDPSAVFEFQLHAVPDGSSSNVPMHSAASQTFGSAEEEWRVIVTSLSQEINDEVVEKLEQFKQTLIVEEELVNSNIAKFEENEIYEIKKAADDDGATIEIDKTSTIKIFGLLKNVIHVKKKVTFLLGELADAIMIAKVCVWKMENASGTFEPFPLRVSHKINKNYEISKTSTVVLMCGEKYLIDLANMTYSGEKKNGKIKREASSDFPPEWAPMSGEQMMRVTLSPDSSEYNNVLALFENSDPMAHVQMIERIQNPNLYHAYQVKMRDVEKHMQINEPFSRELFHGTSDDVIVEDICRHGFDRGYAGKNATLYGRGVYFAVDSSYSLDYCDESGLKHMFLALVLTGNYCQGCSSYFSAPSIGSSVRKYDSVVDNPSSPNMFVVFKDSSVYPNYLITLM